MLNPLQANVMWISHTIFLQNMKLVAATTERKSKYQHTKNTTSLKLTNPAKSS